MFIHNYTLIDGPNHRLTYVSSLICFFLKMDGTWLCAGCTAPYHSWRNLVEIIMSVLNLGLKCIGLAHDQIPDEFEKRSKMQQSHWASRNSGILSAVQDSFSSVQVLLTTVFSCLKLHEHYIKSYRHLQLNWMSFGLLLFQYWCHFIRKMKTSKGGLKNHSVVAEFLDNVLSTHLIFWSCHVIFANQWDFHLLFFISYLISFILYFARMVITNPSQRFLEQRQRRRNAHHSAWKRKKKQSAFHWMFTTCQKYGIFIHAV